MTFDFASLEKYEEEHPYIPKRRFDLHWKERVRKLRKVMDRSQEDFALFIGCTTGTVYKWEAGKSKPTKFYQIRLAMAEEKFVLPMELNEQAENTKKRIEERINAKATLAPGS